MYWAKPAMVQKHLMTMENLMLNFHAQNPNATGMPKSTLLQHYPRHLEQGCFDALFQEAVMTGRLVFSKGEVSHPKAGAGARKLEEQAAEALLGALLSHGTTPLPLDDMFAEAGLDTAKGRKAVLLLEEQDRAQRINKTLCFASDALYQLKDAVVSYLKEHGSASATELKDAMGTSRKYAIPLLEYFDETGITKRNGDSRTLAK